MKKKTKMLKKERKRQNIRFKKRGQQKIEKSRKNERDE